MKDTAPTPRATTPSSRPTGTVAPFAGTGKLATIPALNLGLKSSGSLEVYSGLSKKILARAGHLAKRVVEDAGRQIQLVLGRGKGRDEAENGTATAQAEDQAVFQAEPPNPRACLISWLAGYAVFDQLDSLYQASPANIADDAVALGQPVQVGTPVGAQTGLAKLGTMWAFEQEGVVPVA